MYSKILILTIFILLLLTSCSTVIPLSKTFYDSNSKVAVIYTINDIDIFKGGSQGLIQSALTQGEKYRKPLKIVDEEINPTEKIKSFYQNNFKSKSKELIEFSEIDVTAYPKFKHKGASHGKVFYAKDLREIKEEYEVDELIFVTVNYGILVTYQGIIELSKNGYCSINTEIVNLEDNTLLYRNNSYKVEKIIKGWKKPPKYESLQESIDRSIHHSIELEKQKLF